MIATTRRAALISALATGGLAAFGGSARARATGSAASSARRRSAS